MYVGDYSPDVRPCRPSARGCWSRRATSPRPAHWAREQAASRADDELTYLREYEHVTLARLLLAEHAREGSEPALRDATGSSTGCGRGRGGGRPDRHPDRGAGAAGARPARGR